MGTIALPNANSKRNSTRVIQTALFLLCAVCGCKKPGPNPAQIQKTVVIATVYPLADIARQVGGPFVEESWIVESGQSLKGVQSTPDLRSRLNAAQLVICNGVADGWASDAITNSSQRLRIVRLDLLASGKQLPVSGLLWLDPVLVQDLARELSGRLLITHVDRETYFQERANEFAAQLDAIVKEYLPKFVAIRNRRVLVLNADFNPLLYRFGLEPIQPIDANPMTLSENNISALKDAAKQSKTTILLIPADLPKVVTQDLSFRTGLELVPIDALGGTGQGGRDYLKLMRYNLEQLLHATSFQ